MRSNYEYDYFGDVVEYVYDYFASYKCTITPSLVSSRRTVCNRSSAGSSILIDILLVLYQNSSISIDTRFLLDTRNSCCKSNQYSRDLQRIDYCCKTKK